MSHDSLSLEGFGGTARLFPLPNLVLFPVVAQPLHVFEPRYRQLMADALAGDRLIGMALLRPGWEGDYQNRPPIHPVVCLGRIHQEERRADGRYDLLLEGATRARIIEEVAADRLYRVARVELMPDVPADEADEAGLRQGLRERALPFFSGQAALQDRLGRLIEGPIELGGLCDVFGFALPLEVEEKQELLSEARVAERVRLLLRRLGERAAAGARKFPPKFSDN